ERLDRAVDDLRGHLVAMLEGAGPHAAREPAATALLHDLEQIGVLAALGQAACAGLHRGASGIGLEAAAAAAGAAPAVLLDHRMADLPSRATAGPELAVEHQPTAHAGAPED